MSCECRQCVLERELATEKKRSAYFREQAILWASVVSRQETNYAERVQLDDFRTDFAGQPLEDLPIG